MPPPRDAVFLGAEFQESKHRAIARSPVPGGKDRESASGSIRKGDWDHGEGPSRPRLGQELTDWAWGREAVRPPDSPDSSLRTQTWAKP